MRKVLCFFVLNTVPRQPSLPAGQCERVPLPSKSHPGQHVVHKQKGAKHIQAEEWDQQNRRDCGSRKNQMPDDNRSTCKRPVHGAVEYSTAHVRCSQPFLQASRTRMAFNAIINATISAIINAITNGILYGKTAL